MIYNLLNIDHQEILDLDQVKHHLRITHDYDDVLIKNLIYTAIEFAEKYTNLHIFKRDVNLIIHKCNVGILNLKYTPLKEITKAIYKDNPDSEDENTLLIKENQNNGKIMLLQDENGNFINDHIRNKYVNINYISGYGSDISASFKHLIIAHIAKLYDAPADIDSFNSTVQNLYKPFRMIKI